MGRELFLILAYSCLNDRRHRYVMSDLFYTHVTPDYIRQKLFFVIDLEIVDSFPGRFR